MSRPARGAASLALVVALSPACSGSGTSPPPDAGPTGNFALHFNGTTDYATTGTAGFPSGQVPQTISLWVRYAAADSTQTFVSLREDFASGIQVVIRDGTIAVWTVFGDVKLAEAPTPPLAGVWHHVAYVLDVPDGGYSNTLYIDGAVSATTTATPNQRTPVMSWIGSLDGTQDFFAGDLDEIRVWHLARTGEEVLEEMRGQVASKEPGLVAYFDCNVIQGTRVPDDSGNGNDATLGGGDPRYMPTLVPSDVPPAL